MNTTNSLARNLLKNCGISLVDSARLMLEATEELAVMAEGCNRKALICLLRRVIHAGIVAVRAEENTVSFEKAAWASVEARNGRREATKKDLRYFVRRILKTKGIASRPLRSISSSECRDLLKQAFGSSVHSYRKGRAILHSIFAFGYRREWCSTNPVDLIEVPTVEEKEIVPLKASDIQRLKQTAKKQPFTVLQLPLHLMLYCGIRPAEVERIEPQRDINWSEKTVTIRPRAAKTGGGRVIPLRGLNAVLVKQFKMDKTLKYPPKLWRRFRCCAGFHHWVPDVLRHTFATYHAVHFRNLPELQLEMGHRDATLLRTRYINAAAVSRREAREFWQ